MANSLRAKLSKLRHDRHITEEEYQEFIKKLDGHDKQIRAEVISQLVVKLESNMPSELDGRERYGYTVALTSVLEELKEQKND